MNIILTEQDIINTYNKIQQEQCKLYIDYHKIKQVNLSFGYKKIAKLLGQPYPKTRWWHSNKHKPYPIQTVEWLKEKNLLPLTIANNKIKSIIKVLGTTFGDGGIFGNLNAIFLSSSEMQSINEFKEDINSIFGKEIENNSRLIEGGIKGHSWCYQNTNRNVIRFFQALGAPIGRKTNIGLKIPSWILNIKLSDHFFGALFGNEIGIPKIHKENNRTNSLDFGLVCNKNLLDNRINFLKDIKNYLLSKNINSNNPYISIHKEQEDKLLIKLPINLNFDNIINFYKNISLYYSDKKKQKLISTLNDLIKLKNDKFYELSNKQNKMIGRPYSKEWIKHNLRLTDKSLNFILSNKTLEEWN